jgi:hypothetical protein
VHYEWLALLCLCRYASLKLKYFVDLCSLLHFFPNLMLQGMLQQLQVTFDADILLNLLEFYGFVTSVKFYNKRVHTIVFPGSLHLEQKCRI